MITPIDSSARELDLGDYDIGIIGYGPTSVILANCLGQYGIKTLVIERDRSLYARARAVTVDGTTMRIFQALGLDEQAKVNMDVTTYLRWKTYAGIEFLRLAPQGSLTGHANSYMIFQPKMEATLRQGVDRFEGTVDVKYGMEFLSLKQDAKGVDVVVKDTASEVLSKFRAKYLIGADGGSSKVRRAVDIEMDGHTKPRTWIVIDAKIKRWWPERELLTFWSDPVRPVVDIPLALDYHRWEIPLGPDERKEDFESRDVMWKLLAPLGINPDKVEIVSHAFYNHHVRQARRWRKERVLLAGDSAHLMPPWAGQGMQSGMRDSYNLAWKLRSILNHGVSDAILDTYQPERQPHVNAVTQSSIGLGKLIETEKGIKQSIRNLMLPIITKTPGLREKMRKGLGIPVELKEGFLAGVPAKGNPIGRVIPQPKIARQDGHRILLDSAFGSDFVVLGLDVDPRSVLTPVQQRAWEVVEARFITVRSSHAEPKNDQDIVDFENKLAPWFKQFGASVVVLRPDRFVVASDNTNLDFPD
jgi:3-(3-hydroxy-phenyl)propionate hydroxylase